MQTNERRPLNTRDSSADNLQESAHFHLTAELMMG